MALMLVGGCGGARSGATDRVADADSGASGGDGGGLSMRSSKGVGGASSEGAGGAPGAGGTVGVGGDPGVGGTSGAGGDPVIDAGDAAVDSPDGGIDADAAPIDSADCKPPSCVTPGGLLPLALWLTADRELTCDDNQRVTRWADQSGHGRNAVPPDGQVGPECAYPGRAIGGIDVVTMIPTVDDPEGEVLEVDLGFLAGTDFTIFIVQRRGTARRLDYFLGSRTPPDASAGRGCSDPVAAQRAFFAGYDTLANFAVSVWGDACDLSASVSNESMTPAPVIVDAIRYDHVAGYSLFINGAPRASSTRAGGLNEVTGGYIGRGYPYDGVNDSRFRGDIAEVLMYQRALSDDERHAIEQYLRQHWGLTF